ncbi:MAG TPA: transglutaminase-like domain-containing protein [Campylobacterales bacterium]|nr:transglutaminase-like domain-containing protein [Campylobacterales bacterium]
MQRREFLALCAAGCLVGVVDKSAAFESSKKERIFDVSYDFDLSHIRNTHASLWAPLPLSNDFQSISKFKILTTSKEYQISSANSYGANLLYAKWAKEEPKRAHVSFAVTMKPFERAAYANHKTNDYIKSFISPTKHVQTDGIVLQTSNKIVAGHKEELSKARAIYDWVVENMYRDPNVKGCGAGNAKEALEQKRFGGKCLDISAVFVALLRSQGIAARELMGVRLGASAISKAFGSSQDITGAQHCRAEFFIEGYGWIRADPADITKLRLQENLPKGSQREKEIADSYFGSFETNWLQLNFARDFELYPKPVQFPLDQFNYPYAEADDEVLDFYDPKSFRYSMKSIERI